MSPTTDPEKMGDDSGSREEAYVEPLSREIKEELGGHSTDDSPEKTPGPPQITFPEGGRQAWLVAIGGALVMFGTFGYVNAFG